MQRYKLPEEQKWPTRLLLLLVGAEEEEGQDLGSVKMAEYKSGTGREKKRRGRKEGYQKLLPAIPEEAPLLLFFCRAA